MSAGRAAFAPDPIVRIARARVLAFHLCAGVGLVVCLALAALLTRQQQLSLAVTIVIACAGLIAFLALMIVMKIVTGRETLIYYHHEIAVLVTAAGVLSFTGLPVLPYLDISVLGVGTLLAFGRIGCFLVGCCHGRPSAWGVRYRHAHADEGFPRALVAVRLFPIQLVESAWVFATVAIGAALVVTGAPAGSALAWYTTFYGAARYGFEFLRGDASRPYRRGLSEAQWTSLVLMIATAAAELRGIMPLTSWHLWVTAAIAATSLALAYRTHRERRLFEASHVNELAQLVTAALTRTRATGDIHIGRTSLGIQVSATDVDEGPRHLQLIAFSSCGPALSPPAVARLGRLIARLRDADGNAGIMESGRGVYRMIVPRTGTAYAV